MAESCQAYKCTYGSRLEYLFSFIIFLFFPFFFYHQVSSLLATLPLRRNSRKELHFWWELIRQAFTWNSSRLLRVPELGWWRYNLLRGTNCSNFCSGTERAQRSASHRLYFAEQNRRDSEKQTPKRQKVNQSTKADFTLLTKKETFISSVLHTSILALAILSAFTPTNLAAYAPECGAMYSKDIFPLFSLFLC